MARKSSRAKKGASQLDKQRRKAAKEAKAARRARAAGSNSIGAAAALPREDARPRLDYTRLPPLDILGPSKRA